MIKKIIEEHIDNKLRNLEESLMIDHDRWLNSKQREENFNKAMRKVYANAEVHTWEKGKIDRTEIEKMVRTFRMHDNTTQLEDSIEKTIQEIIRYKILKKENKND